MAKKVNYKLLIYVCASVFAVVGFTFAILGITKVISALIATLVSILSLIFGAVGCYILFLLQKKAIKKEKEEKLKAELIAKNNRLKQLYDILKIPYQYAEDGHIKDIFELLKIVPQYDADGKRLPLVYELLKMMPEFTKDGQEKPLVFAIKNRVKKVAKGIVSPLTLTYKPKKEQEQTSQGKTEAKGKDEKQTDAQKSVKDKAKEVSKKPAKKAGGSEPKGQLGIIHGSASAVKAGSVKGAKPEETKIGGFGSYKNEGVSVGSALNQTKSGEEKNSAIQQPSESKTNNSKPVSISTQQAPVNNKDGTFEDKNIDEVNTSYMFINEEEMEK